MAEADMGTMAIPVVTPAMGDITMEEIMEIKEIMGIMEEIMEGEDVVEEMEEEVEAAEEAVVVEEAVVAEEEDVVEIDRPTNYDLILVHCLFGLILVVF